MSNISKKESFKERVTKFWDTFIQYENIFSANNESNNIQEKIDLLNDLLNKQFPNHHITFEFSNKDSDELFLSPNGNWVWLIITDYIVSHAPQNILDRWNVYSTKKEKNNIVDFSLDIAGTKILPEDLVLYYQIDQERRKINVDFFVKGGEFLPDDLKSQILFVLLDNSISELYTMFYIGDVKLLNEESVEEGISIDKFKSKVDEILINEGWCTNPNPDDSFTSFELEPKVIDTFTLRDDIYLIITKRAGIEIYNNFLDSRTNTYFSDFRELGISFKTLFYDFQSIPSEEVIELRDKILEEMTQKISSGGIAKWISSATAVSHTYIDFIVYDLDAYTEIVKDIISKYNLPIIGIVDFDKVEEPLYL